VARLFIVFVVVLNVGFASAVSSAIDTPFEKLQTAVALGQKPRAQWMRLRVSIRDEHGNLLAEPSTDLPLNSKTTVRASRGENNFYLTATVQNPRSSKGNYNKPGTCHIVDLRLVEEVGASEKPFEMNSMLRLCGESLSLPVSATRQILVDLQATPHVALR
jgi:hypothetical protein